MAIRDWPAAQRPREKLLARGANALTDAELLAIFLRTGIPGKNAVELADGLIERFGSLQALLSAERSSFLAEMGLGPAKYTQLQAVLELAKRHYEAVLKRESVFNSFEAVKHYLSQKFVAREREVFACLFLDNQNRLIAYEELFLGTLTSAEVHPREVVRRAMYHNAAAMILAHNHPSSGVAEPSEADRVLTKVLVQALALLEVRVLDHVIVGAGELCSFAERGWL